MSVNRLNLMGKKFGRLTVVEFVSITIDRQQSLWRCVCDCGNEKIVRGHCLKSGRVKSCICLDKEKRINRNKLNCGTNSPVYKHGLSKNNVYKNEINERRRSRKLNQSPVLTEIEEKKLLLYYKISEYLGDGWHVDHIQPISKGGLHHPDNLQVLSAKLNQKKFNRWPLTPEEEIKYRGIRI